METMAEMIERHKQEIADFQDRCVHEVTEWSPFMLAPGHLGPTVRICKKCDKIIDRLPL